MWENVVKLESGDQYINKLQSDSTVFKTWQNLAGTRSNKVGLLGREVAKHLLF